MTDREEELLASLEAVDSVCDQSYGKQRTADEVITEIRFALERMNIQPPRRNMVCGLPLQGGLDEGEVPLEAIVVVKHLTVDGSVAYTPYATPEVTTVEALGMLDHARRKLEHFEQTNWGD